MRYLTAAGFGVLTAIAAAILWIVVLFVLPLTVPLVLVANHPLRTLDAIHVASARLFAARMTALELTFVSADTRQSAVAASIGLPTKDIGS